MSFLKLVFIFSILFFCHCFGQDYKKDSLILEEITTPLYSKMKKISDKSDSLYKLQKNVDIEKKILFQKKIDSLDHLWTDIYKSLILEELNYFQSKPGFKNAIEKMSFSLTRKEAVDFYPQYFETFEKLDSKIKNSEEGIKFKKKFTNLMNAQVGKTAPQFVLKDIKGNEINLNENKGKVILLDFWASWCEPCLKDLPILRKELEKYNKEGFEIISISRDKNLDNWRNSIIKNGTQNFKHISTVENNSDIENLYVITGIPVKFLIDRNGIILKKWRGGSDEILEEIQDELSKIFYTK